MFGKACDFNELRQGKYEVAVVNRILLMIVWPSRGDPRAFHGMCPHANEPLADARFDGETLTCAHHDWAFSSETGACNGRQWLHQCHPPGSWSKTTNH